MGHLILLLLSFLCFGFAAVPQAAHHWNRLVAVGLAAMVASMISW